MAKRPLFIPQKKRVGLIRIDVDFEYVSGQASVQKRKCVRSLHKSIKNMGYIENPLEVSTASECELGIKTSAFNLNIIDEEKGELVLESVYHATKVFKNHGVELSLLRMGARESKKRANALLKKYGVIEGYHYRGIDFPEEPKSLCFTWLYFQALKYLPTKELSFLAQFDGFTDLNFKIDSMGNCQAHAMALFVSIYNHGIYEPWALTLPCLQSYLMDMDTSLKCSL